MASVLNLSPSIHELDSKCIRSLSILQVIRCANNLKDQKLAKYNIFFFFISFGPQEEKGRFELVTFNLRFVVPSQLCYPLSK